MLVNDLGEHRSVREDIAYHVYQLVFVIDVVVHLRRGESHRDVAVPVESPTRGQKRHGASRSKIAPTRLRALGSRQIVEADTARGQCAFYVQSRGDGAATLERDANTFEKHALDVIVPVWP